MKNLWKNLCACGMALACGVGVVGCGKDKDPVSTDLDGDGKIASWETLFEKETSTISPSSSVQDIVYIRDAGALLDINNNVNTRKIYVLASNIDLGGRTISINLGNSELYGHNYVISNFKLGEISTEDDATKSTKCLFFNGTGIYGVRLFMGVQTLNVDSATITDYTFSPFYNVNALDTIAVKGRININGAKVEGRENAKVNASMMYEGRTAVVTNGEELVEKQPVVSIRNTSIEGKIVFNDVEGSQITSNIGSLAGVLHKDSTVYNAYANVDISATPSNRISLGGIVGENNGFISTAVCTGNISLGSSIYSQTQYVGGIAGVNKYLSEIKNCVIEAQIGYAKEAYDSSASTSTLRFYYGGAVGYNDGGIIEFVQSDATLSFKNLNTITAGSVCGYNDRGIVSYGLCRGSITCDTVKTVKAAQVSGHSVKGLFEKLICTTEIKVNNSTIGSTANIGMVTIFENDVNESQMSGEDLEKCPYFKNILVTGNTEVHMKKGDKFYYQLGLRNSFSYEKLQDPAEEGEQPETVQESRLPYIFNNVYYLEEKTKLKLYYYDGANAVESSPTVSYNKEIGTTSITATNLIDKLDFKSYLNHNLVNIPEDLQLNKLYFTLSKELQEQSYFGESKYNGELAYYDKEFDKSYIHDGYDGCEKDNEDELISFLYEVVTKGFSDDSYVMKFNKDFFEIDWKNLTDFDESTWKGDNSGMSPLTEKLDKCITSGLTCLNTIVTRTPKNANGVAMEEDSTDYVKYLEYKFTFGNYDYFLTFDVNNLENGNREFIDITKADGFVVYLRLKLD